jgi:hypothetical protein
MARVLSLLGAAPRPAPASEAAGKGGARSGLGAEAGGKDAGASRKCLAKKGTLRKLDVEEESKNNSKGGLSAPAGAGVGDEVPQEKAPADAGAGAGAGLVKPKKGRKGLRKRQRSRGHGTLNMEDLEHAQKVDVNEIDIKSPSLDAVFGTFGALPVGSVKIWDLEAKVPRGSSPLEHSIKLLPGCFKVLVSLKASRWPFPLPGRACLVKVWLINTARGYSKECLQRRITRGSSLGSSSSSLTSEPDVTKPGTGCSCRGNNLRAEFDLRVLLEDCADDSPMELRIQLISESKIVSSKVALQVHRLKDCAVEEAQTAELVLEGQDQTEQIIRTRTERARSARIAKQLKDQAELELKHRRVKTALT